MDDTTPTNVSYKLTRSAGGLWERLQVYWQKKWFRWASYLVGALLLAYLLLWAVLLRNLPDAEALIEYQSPLPTVVRDVDGQPFHSYARERRVQLEYADFKPLLIRSYLAAEDKTFFSHGGIDYVGILGAVFDNIFSSRRSRGASTITQQVAKNLLLTNEYSYTRKIKEAILAYRIENALTKQQILSLYLNEIALGRQAFGVEAAAQAYFGRGADQLQLHEMAFLATLPKAPEKYGREKYEKEAIARRNWVLGEMQNNGWITVAQRDEARAQPLGLISKQGPQFKSSGGYFAEEVRRQLKERFGETSEEGPFSVYSGGLWVRTSMNPRYQDMTTEALRDGLLRYHAGKGWQGPVSNIPMKDGQWQSRFASSNISIDYKDWRMAVALSRQGGGAQIGFASGETGYLTGAPSALKAGDIIAVAPAGGKNWSLRVIPEVGGGMVVQNPLTGRVLAMQGGFDAQLSSFNRATQAMRQPGSTIKPFVYATALDNGMTPTSIIIDGPFCVFQSAALGRKCFRNFGGGGGSGPHTMRWGLEQSRNLMTVRAANDSGMKNVADTFRSMNIGDYPPYLAFALGAGDTTVLKMTNAYSMLVNHGRELKPTVIDFVQSRNGKVIWPTRWKPCDGCNAKDWDGKAMPRFKPGGKQVMDPVTAYQVVHMLEGVVQRGTATILRDLDRPIFGKTGTSTGPTNVWFVGGAPNLVAGVYLGYDKPRNMGGYAQGGSLAAPIFKQFARKAFVGQVALPFTAPNGVRLVRVDRVSGKRVYGAWPSDDPKGAVIWEAFKAETEPKRSIRQEELAARGDKPKKRAAAAQKPKETSNGSTAAAPTTNQRDQEFLNKEGGIY
ncbi:penicillin-binding protein 1A [Sphingorhabdus sp.]|jgi:penicillin-binding protein 1A|uniref:penicillin-binding protein 1A n=2 Tax=Sphingorhabdus sp. TaxID=1902408 RepID=UPI003BAE5611|nr:transglycosylase domain-containing protein [Sphingomonadales bacterium]